MKKKISTILAFVLLASVALGGCGTKTPDTKKEAAAPSDDKTITVGASVTPHSEILEQVKDTLAKEGYTLKIVTYNDYVLPNKAVSDGELDANFFQHQPYLDDYNKKNKSDLVSVGAIHFEPMGIFGGKTKSLDAVKDGATIAVPNDSTNEARALLLLESQGLIKLKKDAGVSATIQDIESYSKKIKIQEIEAAQIARALGDVDLGVINGNYAIEAKLSLSDALAVETSDSLAAKTYANIVVVNKGHEKDAKIQALVKALQSDAVRQFIKDNYKGAVVPVF
jgi:ABC-type metal ion transport system, periplasmic component/surface antigen